MISQYDPESLYKKQTGTTTPGALYPNTNWDTSNPNAPVPPPENLPVENQPKATETNPVAPAAVAPNPRDPAWVDQFLAEMAKRPGVNPSVINDPNYWRQKMLSGELGSDINWITQRMMQPEGPPAGGGGQPGTDFASFLSGIPGGPTATGLNSSAGLSVSTNPGGWGGGGIQDAYKTALMSLLNTPQTVDAQSLAAGPEAAGYRIGSQRGAERARRELAAQAEQEGWAGSGAFNTKVGGINQQRAEGEAQFLGTLANQKLQQQREQLVQGISFAQNMGQFEMAQGLQRELANLDAALKRQSMDQASQQFLADLALRRELGLGQLGYNYSALQLGANQNAANALTS